MSHVSIHPRSGLHSRLLRRTGGVTAAGVAAAGVAAVLAAPPAAASGDPWAAVRQCESGGNYSINNGTGFYGAYQMTADAWHSVGFSGVPSSASPAMQDEAARRLYARYGTAPWPACGKRYGGSAPSSGYSASAVPSHRVPSYTAPRQVTVTPRYAAAPSRYTTSRATPVPVLSIGLAGQSRADVLLYQIALQRLGFQLAADGRFGPVTAATTMHFQAAHGLMVDGRVGSQTRAAIIRAR
jgi:resuscitation-promoting factor RpfA